MPSLSSRVEAAWTRLWSAASPFHLPTALRSGSRVGHTWFRPLAPLTFRRTGPVVLLNQEPWGSVDVDLFDNELSQIETLTGHDFTLDEATGAFSATVRFSELKYAGKYRLRRGVASGSAFKAAFTSLKGDGTFRAGDDQNLTLARNYQNNLSTSESGRYMLSTYYQFNDAYAQIYDNSKFLYQWQNYQTNGKTTATFAAQTANAAQNPSGPPVNGDPDYNPHSLRMNLLVVATCNAQQNADAATAAGTFQNQSTPVAQQPQTVNSVMGVVNTSTPPSLSLIRKGVSKVEQPRMLMAETPELLEARESLRDIIAEIQKEEDDVRAGLIHRENTGRPIDGEFRAYFGTQNFTLTGTIVDSVEGPVVQFTNLTGPAPEVRVQLGVFPGNLHAEVDKALDRANFLKGVLGQRIAAALNDPSVLGYLASVLSSALRTDRTNA